MNLCQDRRCDGAGRGTLGSGVPRLVPGVDRLEHRWGDVRLRFLRGKTPVINRDNGPAKHSRRSQFPNRTEGFARKSGLSELTGVCPALPEQVQPDRASLGYPGDVLERFAAGLG